ncbi:DUF2065 domain-containing protein [Mailhella sp.]|uniref:DUF2065 domain-containing protein n=1 Tax=Mailhella sp. TaxID=1981029 RepID=UPI004063B1C6
MDFNFALFFMALGLAFSLEAMFWLISPEQMREITLKIAQTPVERLRAMACVMLAFGLLICAVGRFFL